MATSSLKNAELEFTNSNSATGSISFDTNNKIQVNRTLQSSGGIVATSFAVSGDSNYVASTDFDDITAGDLKFKDDSGDVVTVTAPSSVTAHTLTIPSAQGASKSYLRNDGSGGLSWVTRSYAYGSVRGYNGNFSSGWNKFTAWGTQGYFTNVSHDQTNHGLKVEVAGVYRIDGFFSAKNIDSNSNLEIKLFLNGTQIYHNYAFSSITGNINTTLNATVFYEADVNDVFYLWHYLSNSSDSDCKVDCAGLVVQLVNPSN